MLSRFLACRKGATVIEYGVICAVVFLAIIGGVAMLGNSTNSMFSNTNTAVTKAMK